jgi:hypothetical protein
MSLNGQVGGLDWSIVITLGKIGFAGRSDKSISPTGGLYGAYLSYLHLATVSLLVDISIVLFIVNPENEGAL